jgi:hypothetical protein
MWRVAPFVVLLATARCPVGCARPEPIPLTLAPPEPLAVERLSHCVYRVVSPVPKERGFVSADIDGFAAPENFGWKFDQATGLLEAIGGYCNPDAGVNVEAHYHRWVNLGGT